MNDNNLIKAQLWADVYGGTIKNGHSVAAATDRANEAVKEYEGRFSAKPENPNRELFDAISFLIAERAKSFYNSFVAGGLDHNAINACAEEIMKRFLAHEEWLDTTFSGPTGDQLLESYKKIESLQSLLADKDGRIEVRDGHIETLESRLSEKDKIIAELDGKIARYKENDKTRFIVGDKIVRIIDRPSRLVVFGTVVNADSFILHVKPHNPEVLPDYMRHSSIIGVVRNDCERVLEFPSRNHLVKDVQTNDAANTPNPFVSNLHPFVSENADKLAEASKESDLFISNQIPISPSRRSGNTTRIVDAIIQALFNGKKVLVRDHCNSRKSNRALLNKVERRLVNDHGIKWSAVCMEVECLGGDVTIWLENRTGEDNK